MTLEQDVKLQVREEIGDKDANDDIPRKQRFQLAQKFGAVTPEFDRIVIQLPKKKAKRYFGGNNEKVVFNLNITRPSWMKDEGEITWDQKNKEFQEIVNYVVKAMRKEYNQSKPRPTLKPVQPRFQKLPRKFQHPNSTRTGS